MKDQDKTKEQLLKELKTLEERLAKLGRAEAERKRVEMCCGRLYSMSGARLPCGGLNDD